MLGRLLLPAFLLFLPLLWETGCWFRNNRNPDLPSRRAKQARTASRKAISHQRSGTCRTTVSAYGPSPAITERIPQRGSGLSPPRQCGRRGQLLVLVTGESCHWNPYPLALPRARQYREHLPHRQFPVGRRPRPPRSCRQVREPNQHQPPPRKARSHISAAVTGDLEVP